jgi:hypothetical protein
MGSENEIQVVGEPWFLGWQDAPLDDADTSLVVADLWDRQTLQWKMSS